MDNSKSQPNHVVLSTLIKPAMAPQLMVLLFQIYLLVELFVQVTLTISVVQIQDGWCKPTLAVVKLIAVEQVNTEIPYPIFHKAQLHAVLEEFFNIAMLMEYFNQLIYHVEP